MQTTKSLSFKKIAIFILLPLVLDQILKNLVIRDIIPINWICNQGVAFGIPIPSAVNIPFTIIIIIILIGLSVKSDRENNKLISQKNLLYLLMAGAFSNLLDRIIHNCVIDYIDLKYWPVFNLADAFISIAIVLLVYKNLNQSKPKKHEHEA